MPLDEMAEPSRLAHAQQNRSTFLSRLGTVTLFRDLYQLGGVQDRRMVWQVSDAIGQIVTCTSTWHTLTRIVHLPDTPVNNLPFSTRKEFSSALSFFQESRHQASPESSKQLTSRHVVRVVYVECTR